MTNPYIPITGCYLYCLIAPPILCLLIQAELCSGVYVALREELRKSFTLIWESSCTSHGRCLSLEIDSKTSSAMLEPLFFTQGLLRHPFFLSFQADFQLQEREAEKDMKLEMCLHIQAFVLLLNTCCRKYHKGPEDSKPWKLKLY